MKKFKLLYFLPAILLIMFFGIDFFIQHISLNT